MKWHYLRPFAVATRLTAGQISHRLQDVLRKVPESSADEVIEAKSRNEQFLFGEVTADGFRLNSTAVLEARFEPSSEGTLVRVQPRISSYYRLNLAVLGLLLCIALIVHMRATWSVGWHLTPAIPFLVLVLGEFGRMLKRLQRDVAQAEKRLSELFGGRKLAGGA